MGKIFLIISLLILLLGVPAVIILISQETGFRLGAQNPNLPENVQTSGITFQSARIIWQTKNPSQGAINYGLSASNLTLIQPESGSGTNHQVTLERLLPNKQYFFVIKVGEETYDDHGQPYTFSTLAKSPSPTPKALSEEELQKAMGTNNPEYDFNSDGIVNTLDLLLLRQKVK